MSFAAFVFSLLAALGHFGTQPAVFGRTMTVGGGTVTGKSPSWVGGGTVTGKSPSWVGGGTVTGKSPSWVGGGTVTG